MEAACYLLMPRVRVPHLSSHLLAAVAPKTSSPAPPEAGLGKYDPSCGVVLNIQGFGVGRSMSDPGTLEKPSAKKFCGYARSPKQHLESASA